METQKWTKGKLGDLAHSQLYFHKTGIPYSGNFRKLKQTTLWKYFTTKESTKEEAVETTLAKPDGLLSTCNSSTLCVNN